jgi:ferritin-like metal-binding protein YciE
MKTSTLKDLLVHEVRFLYNAEQQIINVVPRLLDSAGTPPEVHSLLNRLVSSSEEAVPVLQEMIQKRDAIEPFRSVCRGVLGILADAETEPRSSTPFAVDVEIHLTAQRLNQYQLAGFVAAHTYAVALGYDHEVQLVQNVVSHKTETGNLMSHARGQLLTSKPFPQDPICRQIHRLIQGGRLIVRTVPGMVNAASSIELQATLEGIIEQSAGGESQLHEILTGLVPCHCDGSPSPGISAMLKEAGKMLMADLEAEATDMELTVAMQRVIDYQLAGYRVGHSYFEAEVRKTESSILARLITSLDHSRNRLMQLPENLLEFRRLPKTR